MILILCTVIAYDIYTEFHEKIDVCLQSLSRCFNAVLPKIFSNVF